MKAASLHDLKKELCTLSQTELMALCLRIARYKKENKELLTYLVFDSDDEPGYITQAKDMIEEQLSQLNKSNPYLAKKTLRKAIRTIDKYVKFSGSPIIELELRIFFCSKWKSFSTSLRNNSVIANIYQRQLEKLKKALDKLHEDQQLDYTDELKHLF